MMEDAPTDNKRRRIAAADGSPQEVRCLADLPSGILAHAASFLAAPSKALFAVALDEDSAVSTNERSSAIVGNEWATLDFGEIEKELAEKLADYDIEKVLLCIHAVNKVKRLKLANCVNITGAGLEPLRGSETIEQIDLSLVAHHKSPVLDPAPQILSCDHVLPILDSIIASEGGCLLRHVQFPLVWLQEPSIDSEFHQFLQRYNQMWANREEVSCLECNHNLPYLSGNEWIDTNTRSPDYGTQCNTCYGCFKHSCYSCKISFCWTCQMDYCDECTKMSGCRSCNNRNCNDCYEHECHQCNAKICSKCVEEQVCHKCGDCDRVFCSECSNFGPGMICCDLCDDYCCDECRLRRFLQGEQDCAECNKRISLLMFA